MANLVTLPYPYYPDPTRGRPVFNGSVFIGEPNLDPEILANRKTVTLRQQDGTEVEILPSAQPLLTGAGGVILYSASAVQVLTNGNYSIKVLNSLDAQVYFVEDAFDGEPATTDQVYIKSDTVAIMVTDGSFSSGDFIETAGYGVGGGGSNMYFARDVTAAADDGGSIIKSVAVPSIEFVGIFPLGIIDIKQFGADGSNTGDQTASINAAAEYYRGLVKAGAFIGNQGTDNPHSEHGVELFFPHGIYMCLDTIWLGSDVAGGDDFSGGVKNINAEAGAIINSNAAGKPAIDCAGGYNIRWRNLTIFGDSTNTPNVGLLLCRSGTLSPNPSAGSHKFIDAKVIGNYTVASVYNYGSEVNTWVATELRNSKADSFSTFYVTSDNSARAITSENTVVAVGSRQSTYAGSFHGGDMRFDVDGNGVNALMIMESPNFGPKIDGMYFDLLQPAATPNPFFMINEITDGGVSEKRNQGTSITNCQFEVGYKSIVEINADVRELHIDGCSFPDNPSDADIVINDGFALRSPSIQTYRGGSLVEPVTYNTNTTGVLELERLNSYVIDSAGFDFVNAPPTFSGTHDGANNASILTDTGASFTVDALIGDTLVNITDGSNGLIASNTATTITAMLSGGSDNDWDTGDTYNVAAENTLLLVNQFIPLDLSFLDVTTNSRAVSVKVEAINNGSIDNSFPVSIRENNNTNVGDEFRVAPSVSGVQMYGEGLVKVINGVIEYNADSRYTRVAIKIRSFYS